MMKPSDLPTHSWKPCKYCVGTGLINEAPEFPCGNCSEIGKLVGTGVEPVAVENPCRHCEVEGDDYHEFPDGCDRQLQLGVPFEIEISRETSTLDFGRGIGFSETSVTEKFLPIRCVVEGDLSSVWVVKVKTWKK